VESTQNHDHIQMAGCTALEKMALDPDIQVAIGDMGGISAIVGTMKGHVDNVGVQQAACAALVNISRHRGTTDEADGAVQALCIAMTRHADNMEIQANAGVWSTCKSLYGQSQEAERIGTSGRAHGNDNGSTKAMEKQNGEA
jgi:hypothetical protein